MRFLWEEQNGVEVLEVDLDKTMNLLPYETVKREVIRKLRENRPVLFDMTGLDFADESAASALAGCARLAKQLKGAFMVFNPHKTVMEALSKAGLTMIVPYRYDQEAAIDEMKRAIHEGDPMGALVRGNAAAIRPSMMVRVDRAVKAGRRHSSRGAGESSRTEKPANPDWRKVLEIYRSAADLARKHDLEFKGSMTFDQFASLMSSKIHDKE